MRRTVLAICSDDALSDLLSMILCDHGYSFVACLNPSAAIDAARQGRPDLILVDLPIASAAGWRVVTLLRSDPVTAEVPLVVSTALVTNTTRQLTSTQPRCSLLPKPFDIDDLLLAVSNALCWQATA